jgi:hypothetical protein
VDELRVLFTLAPQLAERLRQFRLERVSRIALGDTPVRIDDTRCLILHVVPFTFFDFGPFLSIRDIVRNTQYFPPLGTNKRHDWRINFDGFVTLSSSGKAAESQRAYVQIFRSGAVEAVAASISRKDRSVNIQDIDRMIVNHVRLYSKALHECGIESPFAIMASVIGLNGLRLTTGRRLSSGQMEEQAADRDQLHLTEVVLEGVPADNQDCSIILRPMLDQLANSAGCESARSFDESNNYLL